MTVTTSRPNHHLCDDHPDLLSVDPACLREALDELNDLLVRATRDGKQFGLAVRAHVPEENLVGQLVVSIRPNVP